ncbi:MAG TPA: helix-hairpin-helix domain-containing protein [Puia sp.]|nr:helix-hairpin-helix domain-containing protein [Puia sp.]
MHTNRELVLKELQVIPGIGKSIAFDLYKLGIRKISDLKVRNPELLYHQSNYLAGVKQDPCLLYTFRCAVYFSKTKNPDPKKLKWWWWKDKE